MSAEVKWIESARRGDEAAFCHIYGAYKDRLYRFALYRLGNPEDAEDAVSECILCAWKEIGMLRNPEWFSAWIFRILTACCNREIRRTIREREVIEPALFRAEEEAADFTVAVELYEALRQLTDEEREIVLLSVIAGLGSREISGITGLTAGGVRSKLSRSLAKMRKYMEMTQ